jgi:hypothetical protein
MNDVVIRNDPGGHWLWEPVTDMLWSDYVSLLAAMNTDFR